MNLGGQTKILGMLGADLNKFTQQDFETVREMIKLYKEI